MQVIKTPEEGNPFNGHLKRVGFKETSTTTANFRREDFNYKIIWGILEFLVLYIYNLYIII